MNSSIKQISVAVLFSFLLNITVPAWAVDSTPVSADTHKLMPEAVNAEKNEQAVQNKNDLYSVIVTKEEVTAPEYQIKASLDPDQAKKIVTLTLAGDKATYTNENGQILKGTFDKKRASFNATVNGVHTEIFVDVTIENNNVAHITQITQNETPVFTTSAAMADTLTTSVYTLDMDGNLSAYTHTMKNGLMSDEVDVVKIDFGWSLTSIQNDEKHKTRSITEVQNVSADKIQGITNSKISDQESKVNSLARSMVYMDYSNGIKAVQRIKNESGVFVDRLSIVSDEKTTKQYIVNGIADWNNTYPNSFAPDAQDTYFIQDQTIDLSGGSGGCEVSSGASTNSGCDITQGSYKISYGIYKDANGNFLSYGLQFQDKYGYVTVIDYPKVDTVKLNNITYKINIKEGKISLKRYMPDYVTAYADQLRKSLPAGFLVVIMFDTDTKADGYYTLNIFNFQDQTQVKDGSLTSAQLKANFYNPNSAPALFVSSASSLHYKNFPNLDSYMLWNGALQLAQKINPPSIFYASTQILPLLAGIKVTAVDTDKTIHFTYKDNKWKIENYQLKEDYKQITISAGTLVNAIDVASGMIALGDIKVKVTPSTQIYLAPYKDGSATQISMAGLLARLSEAALDGVNMSTQYAVKAMDKDGLVLSDPSLWLTLNYEHITITPSMTIAGVDTASRSINIGNDKFEPPTTFTITNYDKNPPTVISLEELAVLIKQAYEEGGTVQINNYLDVLKSPTKNKIQTPYMYIRTVFPTSVIPPNSPIESVNAAAGTIKINGENYRFASPLNPISVYDNTTFFNIASLEQLSKMINQAAADGAKITLANGTTVLNKKTGKYFQPNFAVNINIQYKAYDMPAGALVTEIRQDTTEVKIDKIGIFVDSKVTLYFQSETLTQSVSLKELQAKMDAAQADGADLILVNASSAILKGGHYIFTAPFIYFKANYPTIQIPVNTQLNGVDTAGHTVKLGTETFILPANNSMVYVDNVAMNFDQLAAFLVQATADEAPMTLTNSNTAVKTKDGNKLLGYLSFKVNYKTIPIAMGTLVESVSPATNTIRMGNTEIKLSPNTVITLVGENNVIQTVTIAQLLTAMNKAKFDGVDTVNYYPLTLIFKNGSYQPRDPYLYLKLNYIQSSLSAQSPLGAVNSADKTLTFNNKIYQVDPKAVIYVDNKAVTMENLASIFATSVSVGKKVVLMSGVPTSEAGTLRKINSLTLYFLVQ